MTVRQPLPVDRTGPGWPTVADAPRAPRRIYAIGDIHGHAMQLDAMRAAILVDIAAHPAERPLVICLGDLIDRGPDSAGVIERLSATDAPFGPDVDFRCLRGNHDHWLALFLDDPQVLQTWCRKGGEQTLASYGVALDKIRGAAADPSGADALRLELCALLPPRHRRFMLSLPFFAAEGDYFFAHAGVDPERPLDAQLAEDLMWIRDRFLSSRRDFGKVVVHGHTVRRAVESLPNRINVDTGVYVNGVLSCVILEDGDRHLLQITAAASNATDLSAHMVEAR